MRIVFMGTPPFAATILRRLLAENYEVCGVFTQPDKPRNRNKVTPSPVKEVALEHGIPVFQPVKMRDGTALADMQSLAPDAVVVAAYGRILPKEMLDVPPLGCINVHASLLPKYRGAAPINRAILNGEKKTGVTIMYMDVECDTGDMVLTKECPILPDENAEELFEKLALLGADAIAEALPQIADKTAPRIPQNNSDATYAAMLTRELSPIDWAKSDEVVQNQIRALIPWPCAVTTIDGKNVKVFRAVFGRESKNPIGTMIASKEGIEVTCGNERSIILTEIQCEGGKRMAANAFLNGRRISLGELLQA